MHNSECSRYTYNYVHTEELHLFSYIYVMYSFIIIYDNYSHNIYTPAVDSFLPCMFLHIFMYNFVTLLFELVQ